MSSHNRSKINLLLRSWPRGTVAVQSWLKTQGVYRQLADAYRKTAWLERVGRGAFIHAGDSVDWTGGLFAVQHQLGRAIHAGGKTALQLQGYAHFLPLGSNAPVWLYGTPGEKLPAWFLQHEWNVRLHYLATKLFPSDKALGITDKTFNQYSIQLSTPERAMLELLHLVPKQESFEEALLFMEGLSTLRPALVQDLLQQCGSVKAKRLFLFLANYCGHPWLQKLDTEKLDLGAGKRVITPHGRLDAQYQITVPPSLVRQREVEQSA